MATSITIQQGTVTDTSIKIRFACTATYASSNYIVYYGCYETGESRQTGVFSMGDGGSYTTSYAEFTDLNPGTEYTFWCELNTTADTMTGITAELEVSTTGSAPFDPPTISITGGSAESDSVTCEISVTAGDAGIFYIELRAEYSGKAKTVDSDPFYVRAGATKTLSQTVEGLPPLTEIVVSARVRDASTDELYDEDYEIFDTLPPGRPDDWDGFGTVSKGAAMEYIKLSDTQYEVYPLTASEWNRFVDRVVEFARHCGWDIPSNYGSSWYVTKGGEMMASQVNYMHTLISQLPITVSLPSAAVSSRNITAAYIIGLKHSLNSIE